MFEQTFKNIDDVLWKEAGCSSELDYTEQTSWMLFLKYLDDLEGERLQRISSQYGGGLAKLPVHRGLAASQIVLVHRRQIVMYQRKCMNALDCRSRRIQSFRIYA